VDRHFNIIPTDELTFDDVVAFCKEQRRENVRLEYKQEFSKKDTALQIAKETAAFANTQGGTAIWGVEEHDGGRPKPDQSGFDLGDDPRQTIVNACAGEVFPPIMPDVSDYLRKSPDDRRGFIVMRVAPSVEVHTVEGRTGIYIRNADHCSTVKATDQQIEHLLRRRRSSVDVQANRRASAIDRLRRGLSIIKEAPEYDLAVTIGPYIADEPLMGLRELHERAEVVSETSSCHEGHRFPLDSEYGIRSAEGALFSIEWKGHQLGMIDVFANVASLSVLRREVLLDPMRLDETYTPQKAERNGAYIGIEAARLVERIIAVIRSARRVCNTTDYYGLLSLTVNAYNVHRVVLVVPSIHLSKSLGIPILDKALSLSHSFTLDQLNADFQESLASIVGQLLWAWGHKEEKSVAWIIDLAEQKAYGQKHCDPRNVRCKNLCPANRDKCLSCRGLAT